MSREKEPLTVSNEETESLQARVRQQADVIEAALDAITRIPRPSVVHIKERSKS